jgi:O-antigen/teichoic acid export membrane protein
MTVEIERLAPEERRALLYGPIYRIVGTPVVAALGLANTAIIVRETGAAVFGLVSLVATITLLFPFADLGIGATVLSASAHLSGPSRDPDAANVVRRAYQVLFAVAGVLVLVALCIMALDGWAALVGFSSGPDDRWAITVAACVFALTIPAGLGVRILIGIDRNPLATLVLMSCPAFALGVTLVLYVIGAGGIWYAVSALGGLLIGQAIGTVLALRLCGLGWSAFARVTRPRTGPALLAGSLWLFVVGVGLPVGLQTGRILLAHLSTPVQLSSYALMAQIYGVCWSVLSTAGLAYWPVFVKRRAATEETVRMWWRLTATFAVIAAMATVVMVVLGPWAAKVLSGGRIDVSAWLALAFGALLVGQAVHLSANVLLTRPNEARWQAQWTVAMAAISIGLGCAAATRYGAVGVVYASALAILAAQVVPDLAWVPRLVRRRPRVGDRA